MYASSTFISNSSVICSMGWFFGFKLHLICNEKGELLNFMITPGDIDDRKPLEYKAFVDFIYGKLVGDKGYISKNLFNRLFVDGIQLITKLKSNMKGSIMRISDRLLLRKRAIIETINDELKNIAQSAVTVTLVMPLTVVVKLVLTAAPAAAVPVAATSPLRRTVYLSEPLSAASFTSFVGIVNFTVPLVTPVRSTERLLTVCGTVFSVRSCLI